MKNKTWPIIALLVLVAISVGTFSTFQEKLAVGQIQPKLGTINPAITQANISQTICNPNWSTKSIRPPTSFTTPLKLKLCKQQNCGDPSKYELDHRIAITDAGAPADVNNLWLQPYEPRPGAHEKDRLEVLINKKICSNEITLKQGQDMLRGDWIKYYNQFIGLKAGGFGDIIDSDDEDSKQ